jgi:hypothetical protein
VSLEFKFSDCNKVTIADASDVLLLVLNAIGTNSQSTSVFSQNNARLACFACLLSET